MVNGVDEMFDLDATLLQVEEKRRVEAEAERESRVLFLKLFKSRRLRLKL